MTVEGFAPAKINLTLHVTGQRDDGYHLLDSLVVFADVGDVITVEKAAETTLTVTGPMARGVPTDNSNLVVQAANLLGVKAQITLEKNLPSAAGIGGGSSDAAATLRALAALYDMPLPSPQAVMSLGADVPVCMGSGLLRMRGVGEQVDQLGVGADWPMILINPGVAVPTPSVFKALPCKDNPEMPVGLPDWLDWNASATWLALLRNDLESPAISVQPVISDVLRALRISEGCMFARMSGSGATCFGLYNSVRVRDRALSQLRQNHPHWWAVATQQYVEK